jgi:hypothetical protein
MKRWNRLSWRNDRAVLFRSDRPYRGYRAGAYRGSGYRYGAAAVGAAAVGVGAAAAGAYYRGGCGYDAYGNWVCPKGY